MTNKEVMQQALDSDNPDIRLRAAITLRTALEQQQAKPIIWRDMVVVTLVREGINKHRARELADHFANPPQRQWQCLTDEDVRQCSRDVVAGGVENSVDRFAYSIETKLKERNT